MQRKTKDIGTPNPNSMYRYGAPTGTRTLTSFLTTDLKSGASTNYAIGAFGRFRIHRKPHIPPLLACRSLLRPFPFILDCTHPQMVHLVFFGWTLGLAVICSLPPLVRKRGFEPLSKIANSF